MLASDAGMHADRGASDSITMIPPHLATIDRMVLDCIRGGCAGRDGADVTTPLWQMHDIGESDDFTHLTGGDSRPRLGRGGQAGGAFVSQRWGCSA